MSFHEDISKFSFKLLIKCVWKNSFKYSVFLHVFNTGQQDMKTLSIKLSSSMPLLYRCNAIKATNVYPHLSI